MAYKSIFRVSTKDGNVGLFISTGSIGVYSLGSTHVEAFNRMPAIGEDSKLNVTGPMVWGSRGTDKEWLCAFNSKDDFFNYIADDEALAKLDSQGYVLSEYLVEDSLEYLRQSEYQSFFRKDKAIFKASFSLLSISNPLFVNNLAA